MTTSPQRLRAILSRRDATIIPGVPNALFARITEDLGYECAYVTGAGIANMHLGVPDIGLVTLSELADHVRAIADSVTIPVLVDGDTGFGNAVNTVRTVRMIERAGAAGIQLEDQIFPKKCGHFSGKGVVPLDEMVQKIRAAVDTRIDLDFQIVARTDAIAVEGFAAAMERANAFIEAGADVTFVEAPVDKDQMKRIARELSVPQVINVVHGGKTPPLPRAELASMGFAATLYANAALQASLLAVSEVLGSLRDHGSLDRVSERLASFEKRQASVAKDKFDALEARYR
ncbi:oxaloacetate decarboxylase [Bradyrhizobium sp. LHD-71]|uniref:isocitrate lyase/PEP mutase family protein n=1 Tax=Bradyrhizobium sp. LHD-71 TaxID=3072141 RepID=UPI00280E9598|nr:oxaloacetate decarboxylase [Bradyrhizobium sp. LHD-71]MDQ8727359.1 oxaloacetate decarboxylase [Bradyrhizobium sp. LHD-71]